MSKSDGRMKKALRYCLMASVSWHTALMAEPTNLAVVKQALIHYYDSGSYFREVNAVVAQAMTYLKTRLASAISKKPAIVLDIDETALSNYPAMMKMDFGGDMRMIQAAEDQGKDPVIPATLSLYRFAQAHHVAVFFITGRYESERKATIQNLHAAGYHHWNGLILKPKDHQSVSGYKSAARKQLAAQGYDILLNMGDQQSDLIGGYADRMFKLPNPYYLVP